MDWISIYNDFPDDGALVLATDGKTVSIKKFYEESIIHPENWDAMEGEYPWYCFDYSGIKIKVEWWADLPELPKTNKGEETKMKKTNLDWDKIVELLNKLDRAHSIDIYAELEISEKAALKELLIILKQELVCACDALQIIIKIEDLVDKRVE